MNIFLIFIIIIIFILSRFNKYATRINQFPRNPSLSSDPLPFNSKAPLLKQPPNESLAPPSGIEPKFNFSLNDVPIIDDMTDSKYTTETKWTSEREETLRPIFPSEIEASRPGKKQHYINLTGENLTEAIIWAEILGKPKSRINRLSQRNF